MPAARPATAGRAALRIARTPPWIPLGHTSMAPISTSPYTAIGRLWETLFDSENEFAMSLVQFGRSTSSAAPHTAPTSEPRPPITTPASSVSDSWRGNAPGWASCVTTASSPPPSPAAAALNAKASVCQRPMRSPASEAAISSSRTARIDLPMPLWVTL